MDLVSPVIDILTRLWDCTAQRRAYISDYKHNLKSLRDDMKLLQAIKEHVALNVEREVQQDCYLRCAEIVEIWLDDVKEINNQVFGIVERGNAEAQNKCFGGSCPWNCRSRYNLGKEIFLMLADVRDLIIRRPDLGYLTDRIPRPPVDEIPMENTVGIDSIFSQLWSCFQDRNDKSTQVIGLFGMGGVGKTTLLKKLNNNFLHQSTGYFHVVIWVVVPKEVNLSKIQELILEKLGIGDGMWKSKINEHDRAVEILKILKQKRFLLLLDDLWEPINLVDVGVPLDNTNGSRIVFTTRKEEVCGHMNAHKRFRVECLSTEASLDLFRLKVGEDVLNSHHEIPKLAEIVVQECKGLPPALVVIGGAMANWRTPDDWQREIKVLQN